MVDSLLIIADEPAQASVSALSLASASRRITASSSPHDAVLLARVLNPEVILISTTLREVAAESVLATLRRHGICMPVVALSHRAAEDESEALLAAGFAGVLAHPPTPSALRSVLDRGIDPRLEGRSPDRPAAAASWLRLEWSDTERDASRSARRYRWGVLVVDTHERSVSVRGVPVLLPEREYQLLQILCERAGQAVRRRDLIAALTPDLGPNSRSLDVTVLRLRRQLGIAPYEVGYIQTIHRFGYRLATLPMAAQPAIARSRENDETSAGAALATASALSDEPAPHGVPINGEVCAAETAAIAQVSATGEEDLARRCG